ncbi:Lysophospholipase L1 [Mucilaginibacter mallensis]|uniref:Lysophospholipase L1 n=2 Tax=Mucilaginibacter mallensis TaxID=652787 RepID=A0A1H1U476_MUCMA|nr:Lysophospholipase L1 [Mucilaginibacter mallensis]
MNCTTESNYLNSTMKKITLRLLLSLLLLFPGFSLLAQKRLVKVIYIGDSITFGAGLDDAATQAPPAKASAYLKAQRGIDSVEFSNQGHSGYTTVDFSPGGVSFNAAEKAVNSFSAKPGILIFSIMLGTNDSAIKGTHGAPVSHEAYYKNMKSIVDKLLNDFPQCKVVINLPLWYSPNTYNGAQYLQEGLDRLQSYFTPIKNLVNSYQNHQVFLGDTLAFTYFKTNYLTRLQHENGRQGTFYLHPNKDGAADLGAFWGKAIYGVIGKR